MHIQQRRTWVYIPNKNETKLHELLYRRLLYNSWKYIEIVEIEQIFWQIVLLTCNSRQSREDLYKFKVEMKEGNVYIDGLFRDLTKLCMER